MNCPPAPLRRRTRAYQQEHSHDLHARPPAAKCKPANRAGRTPIRKLVPCRRRRRCTRLPPSPTWTTSRPRARPSTPTHGPALREALAREGGAWAEPQLHAYGALAGGELLALGAQANAQPRVPPGGCLRPAHRRVEFHPAWHRLMQLGVEHGVTGFAWRHADTAGAHVARAALMFLPTRPSRAPAAR